MLRFSARKIACNHFGWLSTCWLCSSIGSRRGYICFQAPAHTIRHARRTVKSGRRATLKDTIFVRASHSCGRGSGVEGCETIAPSLARKPVQRGRKRRRWEANNENDMPPYKLL